MLRNINAYAIGYKNKWDKQSRSGYKSKMIYGLVSCFQSEWFFHLIRSKLCILQIRQHFIVQGDGSSKFTAVREEKEVFKYI
jgi:hypothetical protein